MAMYANPPSAFMDQYKQYGLIGIVGTNPSDSSWELQFSSSATSENIDLITTAAESFDWAILPASPPVPDVKTFETQIINDVTISQSAKLQLALFFPLLEGNINNPAMIQLGWSTMVTEYSGTWLDTTTQATVLGYATTFHVPLVP